METVQLEIPVELAQRLQGYPDTLAQIIEWGLCVAENMEKRVAAPVTEAGAQERSKILEALWSTGLVVNLDSNLIPRYQADIEQPRRTPVYLRGKPLSEIIVAERGPEWPEDQ